MKKLKSAILILSISFLIGKCEAQQYPAAMQSQRIALVGATIHVGNGQLINDGVLIMDKGKIEKVGKRGEISISDQGTEIINLDGKQIYPGFISPNTRIGLEEIEAVRATLDYREVGNLNPHIRSLIAYDTDSKITPTVRSNGILLAESTPQGGTISGTSSVFGLDGWNWEDAVYKKDIGIHINWPGMSVNVGAPVKAQELKEDQENEYRELQQFFEEAKAYNASGIPKTNNLKFEAMRGLFKGTQILFVHANTTKEMISAVRFAEEFSISKVVIVGGREAYLITDFLKEHQIPVVLSNLHQLPAQEEQDIDLPYRRAKILYDAGVNYCLSIDGSWQNRNLPFIAGTSVAYGVPKESALASVSLNTAKILGIDKELGSLESGKSATLFVSAGDAFDMKSNQVEIAFIEGKKIDLNNKQKELYRKYQKKYGIVGQ